MISLNTWGIHLFRGRRPNFPGKPVRTSSQGLLASYNDKIVELRHAAMNWAKLLLHPLYTDGNKRVAHQNLNSTSMNRGGESQTTVVAKYEQNTPLHNNSDDAGNHLATSPSRPEGRWPHPFKLDTHISYRWDTVSTRRLRCVVVQQCGQTQGRWMTRDRI